MGWRSLSRSDATAVAELSDADRAICDAYIAVMIMDPRMVEIAALVGDPARANILCALLGGRALTASELSYAAGVSPQTTSGHLAKLTDAHLLGLVKQGRHRYYRIKTPLVSQMLESIMAVAVATPPRYRPACYQSHRPVSRRRRVGSLRLPPPFEQAAISKGP